MKRVLWIMKNFVEHTQTAMAYHSSGPLESAGMPVTNAGRAPSGQNKTSSAGQGCGTSLGGLSRAECLPFEAAEHN